MISKRARAQGRHAGRHQPMEKLRIGKFTLALAVILLATAGFAAGYWFHPQMQMPPVGKSPRAPGGRPVLYYKNPMGLPDTSLVPKKDSMGMDYIPVYAAANEPGTVSVSPARVQMLGVRTAPVELRKVLAQSVRATGTVQPDEGRLTSVTTKFDGVVNKLYVSTTGAPVRAGQ